MTTCMLEQAVVTLALSKLWLFKLWVMILTFVIVISIVYVVHQKLYYKVLHAWYEAIHIMLSSLSGHKLPLHSSFIWTIQIHILPKIIVPIL